jgi:probable HAF family extracellular repeat protein
MAGDGDDTLGTVTITGLPTDLTNVSGGSYDPASGTWTGTADDFNALSFTAGEQGTYNLSISATTTGAEAGSTAGSYTLTVNPAPEGPTLGGSASGTVTEGSSVTLGATDTAVDSDDALGNVTITGLPGDLTDVSGGTYTPVATATVVNFDSVNTSGGAVSGAAVTNYLASYGITFISQSGSPDILPYEPGNPFPSPVSSPNYFGVGGPNSGFTYELSFATPLNSLSFTVPGLGSTSTMAAWSATAYSATGADLGEVGDPNVSGPGTPTQTYTLTGPGIAYVVFSDNVENFAGNHFSFDNLTLNSNSSGTWTGTADQFNALSFDSSEPGTYNLAISATTTGAEAADATESYTLTVTPITAPTSYTFTTIDDPLGAVSSQVFGINDSGEMVGYYVDANDSTHGFMLKNGVFTTIDDPNASPAIGYGTQALGINDAGQIVGWYADSSGITHGFVYDANGFTTLDSPWLPNGLYGINNFGQIVGDSSSGGIEYSGGVFTTLAGTSGAFGINDQGQIVGNYLDSQGSQHGYLDNNGTLTTVDDNSPGASQTTAFGINNQSQIVGAYTTSTSGVNGFIDNAGAFTNLNDPSSNNYTLSSGINNEGQIVGYYVDSSGTQHGFLANPEYTIGAGEIAEPTSEYTTASVVFTGATGALQLDQSQNFTGQISGFGGQDQIDLRDVSYSANTTLGYAANNSNSGGTLTVSDGTHTANLALLGQYSATSFTAASDGHGGTLITDPAVVAQTQLTHPAT